MPGGRGGFGGGGGVVGGGGGGGGFGGGMHMHGHYGAAAGDVNFRSLFQVLYCTLDGLSLNRLIVGCDVTTFGRGRGRMMYLPLPGLQRVQVRGVQQPPRLLHPLRPQAGRHPGVVVVVVRLRAPLGLEVHRR